MVRPRYLGIPTFMRAPFTEDLSKVDIGLAGIPFDGGVTNRPGARHGPREIRNQSSLMRRINQATGLDPHALCRVGDIGDAWVEKPFELTGALNEIAAFFSELHAAGVVPVSAGGDHSVTLPVMRGIAKDRPGRHGAFRRALRHRGRLSRDPNSTTARRSAAPSRKGCSTPSARCRSASAAASTTRTSGSSATTAACASSTSRSFTSAGPKSVIDEARRIVGDGPTYVSFDVDGLDPVYAPGTGTPEIGGITVGEAQTMLRGLEAGSTSSAATSSRWRRRSTPAATPRWWAPR